MAQYLNSFQTVRSPRWRVVANGNAILDCSEISVTSTNNLSADRFRATVVSLPTSQYGATYFGEQKNVKIDVQVGFLAAGTPQSSQPTWTSIFSGQVDHIEDDIDASTINLEGRDLSALMIDAKTHETFSNQTSSQVAQTLAARHGLKANVVKTTRKVGVYYKAEHDAIALGSFGRASTEWGLLSYLAQQEGYTLYMTGETLNFVPPLPQNQTPYLVKVEIDKTTNLRISNVQNLRLSRDFNKSRDIRVTVKSWDKLQKSAHLYSAGGGSSAGGGGGSKTKGSTPGGLSAQEFVFVRPGLTPAQAQAEANKMLLLLTQMERRVTYSEPGNLDYGPRDNVLIRGTNSTWDGNFFVNELTRSFTMSGTSLTQNVSLKNHSTVGSSEVG